jgi:WD40 repeat-containing protein SMU1
MDLLGFLARDLNMSIEISASDVIRIVIQFLQENGLHTAASSLQQESQIRANFVEDRTGLEAAIKKGQWDRVLEVLSKVSLDPDAALRLHELVKRPARLSALVFICICRFLESF